MQNKWFRSLFRQRVLVALLILLQLGFLLHVFVSGSHVSQIFGRIMTLVSVFVALSIIRKREKGGYKLTWVFLILLFPLFGGIFYLIFSFQTSSRRLRKRTHVPEEQAMSLYLRPGDAYQQAAEEIPGHIHQVRYLQQFAGFPIYTGTRTRYFSPGEEFLSALLPELEKAEKYIFLEFFIIQEGEMWNSILEILKRKAAQGVKVRLIYDDMGCILRLPKDYTRSLEAQGIECCVFNPFRPVLTSIQNNRDHRKIVVIDGKVAFTGGINLADEYINTVERFGHWKDCAVMLEGKAAWSFTLIFLKMWSLCKNVNEDFAGYYPWQNTVCPVSDEGYVQPYADSPMDKENVGEHVYLQIINGAKDYVYINTPYLVIDDSMVSALCLAAKSGVDVRIVTPKIWDKRVVHMTTRSYYRELTRAGVRIYEYTRGFMHSKTFVSDDSTATVGTANLDFRSLYLHFECGVWMHGTQAVMQVKQDFLETLQSCQEITESDLNESIVTKVLQDVLRLFAPLM